jgi:hypothetical protein
VLKISIFENNPHGEVGLRLTTFLNPFKVRGVSLTTFVHKESVQYWRIVMTMKLQ